MKAGLKKTLRFIIVLAIGLFLLWIAFRGISFKELVSILAEAKYIWLLLAVVASIFAFFVRARRWTLLMEPLGHKPSLINTYHAVMTGYLANLLFPRLGEITRCATLAKKENMPFDKLVGTVLIERTIDFLTVLALMAFLLFYGSSSTGDYLSENILKPIGAKLSDIFGFSVVIYSILLALCVLGIWLFIKYKNRLSEKPLIRKMLGFITGIIDGFKTIATLKRKWEFLFLTILLWGLYLIMSWLPFYCLASTGHLGAGAALFILVVGSLGMSVPVQSGIGVYHWVVSRSMLVVYGISKDQGLAYATLSHESQILVVAILGSISMFILFRRRGAKVVSSPEKEKE